MSAWLTDLFIVVPASIAAAGGTAVAIMNKQAEAQQARLKIAADHEAYLREKRAEVYEPMVRLLRKQRWDRGDHLKVGPLNIEGLKAAYEVLEQNVRGGEALDLGAAGTVFVGRDLAKAFDDAMVANVNAWRVFLGSVDGPVVDALTEEVQAALAAAHRADRVVFDAIRDEMTWTDEARDVLRASRKRTSRLALRRSAAARGHLPPQPKDVPENREPGGEAPGGS
jgi:hypothetical protein